MRIAVDVSPLLVGHSGASTVAGSILRALHARDDVEVFGWTIGRTAGHPADLEPGLTVRHRRIPATVLHRVWRRVPWPTSERLLGDHDVVHGTNFVVPPTSGAGAVVTVHDLTPVERPESVPRPALAYPGLVQAAIRRGAMIHTPSEYVARRVRDHFDIAAERVRAVGFAAATPSATRPGEGAAVAGGDRYVVALGTVEPRKNLTTLVDAFDRLAEVDDELLLVVAGPDGWDDGGFAAAADEAAHRSRIVRLPSVTARQRDALLADAAVLAFPSLDEGFGFPPIEAMAVGTPVVATTAGSVPEVAGDGARFVDPTDTDGLVVALDEVMTDDEVAADLVRRGRNHVDRLSWETTAAGLLDLYRTAAKG